jgi:hypothetical protein
MANLEGVLAITIGLRARPIQRLRKTLALLPKKLRSELESLQLLTSERRNYAELKAAYGKKLPPLIPPLRLVLIDRDNHEDHLNKWASLEKNAYPKLFPVQPLVQHYLLTQPFRWEEELAEISERREEHTGWGGLGNSEREGSSKLTDEELARLEFGENDIYEQVKKSLEHSSSVTASSPSNDSPFHLTSSSLR